ncbi:MAG: hypothetical protein HY695_11030 [Deltaproteobacteria bacterium]|nr:hypothetical protein [Deltaproteobacteria bacterium]
MMHGGQALVKIFERAGIDYIFSSPGTEWPPVWEALAQSKEKGIDRPKYINCRHEALAVGMAASYAKVTGKTQVVLLHAAVGPLNGAMMLRAAYQERVPMVVCAGESATFGEDRRLIDPGAQWLHSLSDLGGPADILRRCVKWSERVMSPSLLVSSLQRALHIAEEPPAGPVLLGLPFEWMMEEVQLADAIRGDQVVRAQELDDQTIQSALKLLLDAQHPVVLTESVGRDVRAVPRLVELCELLAIPVMESQRPAFFNFPRAHPLYLPYDRKELETADLILIAEAVVPWYPAGNGPGRNAKVVLIADEFPNSRLPFWGYDVDLALVAPPALTLEKLIAAARSSKQFAANQPAYKERFLRIQQRREPGEDALQNEADKHANDKPIDPRWLCRVLDRTIPEEAIIVEETTVYRTLIQRMIRRTRPMSYIARITGGLGVGLSYALGAKLAVGQTPVFALLGDGAFHYNPVPACLGLSQEYELPIIVVLFNNQRYLSMEQGLLKYFPAGVARTSGVHFGAPISPIPDYRFFAEVYGGYGTRVASPDEIQPAIEQAAENAEGGRFALIDVVLNDYSPR